MAATERDNRNTGNVYAKQRENNQSTASGQTCADIEETSKCG